MAMRGGKSLANMLGGVLEQHGVKGANPVSNQAINYIKSGVEHIIDWGARKGAQTSNGAIAAKAFGVHNFQPIQEALKSKNYWGAGTYSGNKYSYGAAEQIGRFMIGANPTGSLLSRGGFGNFGRITARTAALGAVGGMFSGSGIIGGAWQGATWAPRTAANTVFGTDW